ncbi:hypothetical protein QBC38DRAFT_453008 [Podospora fimiseda]|uniref:Tat pathway signal sequence n=1 Tax=Podospora fimiseda TaxID=252190 RepID=A0AAN7BVH8_9PEZI|nr:hypothetical protein QBC38DRAFT_453008 [Podospora fimiseda]
MAPGSSRSSRSSLRLSQPMPMIIEDVADTPRPHVPPKSPNRRSMGPPPVRTNSNRSSLRSPPGSPLATIPGSVGHIKSNGPTVLQKEGPSAPRNQQQQHLLQPNPHGTPFNLRKGWYRKVLTFLLLVGLIVGLSVGLTIGLRKRKSSTSSTTPSQDLLFPSGSFTFTTALSNISTSCSSLWKCYPYALLSPATYHWTITPQSTNSHRYWISSSQNPFVPQFHNISMTLVDGNQYTERFTFSVSSPKIVSTEIEILDGEEKKKKTIVATCRFNSTVLSATIWTRIRASYPANITNVVVYPNGTVGNNNNDRNELWTPWPFAVEVWERTTTEPGGGGDEGECTDSNGKVAVPFVENKNGTTTEKKGECGCEYKNFDLGMMTTNTTITTTTRRKGRKVK